MNRIFRYTVQEADLPVTLGNLLRRRGYSESLLTALRIHNSVLVNGEFRRLIDRVLAGDGIIATLPAEAPTLVPNHSLDLPVLYQDQDILVINKPRDMLVHPAGRGFDDAVGNFCAARWPDQLFRPIGRLDRNTTGALLIARHQLAAALLTQGPVDKIYYAVAEGRLSPEQGLIDLPLARQEGPQITYIADNQGKPCGTRYWTLACEEGLSLLKLQLLSGRTHQIRAHLAALGHPLAGDRLYSGHHDLIDRPALHCAELSFIDLAGSRRQVPAPWPEDLIQLLCLFPHVSFHFQDSSCISPRTEVKP